MIALQRVQGICSVVAVFFLVLSKKDMQVEKMEECNRTRCRTRFSAVATASSDRKEKSTGELRDISLETMYMHADKVFDPGSEVNIKIVLRGVESVLSIDVPATVIRKDAEGFAARFHRPLEWWPIFSLFPLYDMNRTD